MTRTYPMTPTLNEQAVKAACKQAKAKYGF